MSRAPREALESGTVRGKSPAPLLPCPFCGGTDLLIRDVLSWTYISCEACATCGPAQASGSNDEAIAAWNARPPAGSAP